MVVINVVTKGKIPNVIAFNVMTPDALTSKVLECDIPIGEKIRILRRAHNVTQEVIGEVILANASRVSRVESGKEEYKEEELELICRYFGIKGMPLSRLEYEAFRLRLYKLRNLIRDYRLREAEELYISMKGILKLEVIYNDLPMLFRLFEVAYYIGKGELDIASSKLVFFEKQLYKLSVEHIYYYYYFAGSVNALSGYYETALEFYSAALKLLEDKKDFVLNDDVEILYFNIALCYTSLELPHHAINSLNKVHITYFEKSEELSRAKINNALALNNIRIFKLKEAEKLLSINLILVKSINDSYYLGFTLQRLGLLNRQLKKWSKAIKYYDQTISIAKIGSNNHFEALYFKIRCFVDIRDFSKAKKVLEGAINLYGKNETTSIALQSLGHFLTVTKCINSNHNYNKKSTEYIENIAIPYFMSIHGNFEAIDYCTLLERYYKDNNISLRKSLLMTKIKYDIIKKMMFIREEDF